MIERYTTKRMEEIWRDDRKFELWLLTEIAVLKARVKFGEIDESIAKSVEADASFSIERISEIEEDLQHDLLAFIAAVQESLKPEFRSEVHNKMTSYDTEEIPTSIRLRDAISVVIAAIVDLKAEILKLAKKHRKTLMIGRTHCQHAEPITFGFKLLGWYDMLDRNEEWLNMLIKHISVGRIAGAVGVYGDLSPEIEADVCEQFGMEPARHSTQILHRDRMARVMGELAVLAGNIQHISLDLRLMCQPELLEVREPFSSTQKGSSKMPHKKNPIKLEQFCGMARLVRAYNSAAQEDIATWSERDISQSSVERIILPDTFHLIHYMLKKLKWIIEEMDVFPEKMKKNMELSRGCIFSGRVKDLLQSWGVDPEEAYRFVQKCAFTAMETEKELLTVLINNGIMLIPHRLLLDKDECEAAFRSCFDPWAGLGHLDTIFARFGI